MSEISNFQACNSTSSSYKKIILPVETRWNSLALSIRSIIDLKDALLHLRANNPMIEMTSYIPSRAQFEMLEHLLKPLEIIQSVSEKLSCDKKPTLHLVTVNLVILKNLKSAFRDGCPGLAKQFIEKFEGELEARVANFGRGEFLYNVANLLHPKYKGATLGFKNDSTTLEQTITEVKQRFRNQEETPPSPTSQQVSYMILFCCVSIVYKYFLL